MKGELADGALEIGDTPDGERMRFTASRVTAGVDVFVTIGRGRVAQSPDAHVSGANETRAAPVCLFHAKRTANPHQIER